MPDTKGRLTIKDIPDQEIIDACTVFHRAPLHEAVTPERALAHKYPPKLVLAKMAKMSADDILDYGVSLRTAWVVPEDQRDR